MSAKHTPGPWHFLGSAVGVAWEGQGGEAHQLIPVALLENPSDGMNPLEWRANAMLIAAAPMMYEALKQIEPILTRMYGPQAAELPPMQIVRAAIAKAEGH